MTGHAFDRTVSNYFTFQVVLIKKSMETLMKPFWPIQTACEHLLIAHALQIKLEGVRVPQCRRERQGIPVCFAATLANP